MSLTSATIDQIVTGTHSDPFSVLGPHRDGERFVARSFQPTANALVLIASDGSRHEMQKIHNHGLFEVVVKKDVGRYRLELSEVSDNGVDGASRQLVDAYSLPSRFGEIDRHLFAEGLHQDLYKVLGSSVCTHETHLGTQFSVWAPNARRVSVVADFNRWDGRVHVMRSHPGSGIWDIFIPCVGAGALYKFEIVGANGDLLPLKHDPFAEYFEQAPANSSIVYQSQFTWSDDDYLQRNRGRDMRQVPMSIYEVHAGSWRRHEDGTPLSYRELADELLTYVLELGYTHIELLPITEHPFDGSWGYQPIGLFAPTSRFGSPDDFRYFVDACHAANIGVIMDWVPAHFPTDAHGLGQFDGTHLFEHADPRQGMHQDWQTLIFNYGRQEVCNYLLANAVYWIREFHLDGLRVDAVASMLYLDYSREAGEWIPNEFGGRENLEAIAFLKRMNEWVHAIGGFTMAEESTSFPGVSHPTYNNGLGFTFKWNMGWMHDILDYFSKDPIYRQHHQNNLTFGLMYAFSENFSLPFSHDEVVHGKGSMIGKMAGDEWQSFANLRALYTFMYTYPGKKLNFMGGEFAQHHEWQHDGSLHWHLAAEPMHAGMSRLVGDLNRLYTNTEALFETDCSSDGFEWIDCDDSEHSIIAFYRYSIDGSRRVVTLCNFTPLVHEAYTFQLKQSGSYKEIFNSDAAIYGGSGVGNLGTVTTDDQAGLCVTLPPLACLIFEI